MSMLLLSVLSDFAPRTTIHSVRVIQRSTWLMMITLQLQRQASAPVRSVTVHVRYMYMHDVWLRLHKSRGI